MSNEFNPFDMEMHVDKTKDFNCLISELQKGVVNFTYKKKDNSIREAKGTLNLELVPDSQKMTEKKEHPSTQNYYDLDAQDWRCFIKQNFIEFVEN